MKTLFYFILKLSINTLSSIYANHIHTLNISLVIIINIEKYMIYNSFII